MKWQFFFLNGKPYTWSECHKYIIEKKGNWNMYVISANEYILAEKQTLEEAIEFCQEREKQK